ncbi:MAG TPA: hypothetical protein VHL60_07030 [Oxalicibacterium sp.]|nr:hypothetical protein [Oxalicibacterium sp.]
MSFPRTLRRALAPAIALLLTACSPHYNWREIHGEGVPYVVALPARPATFTRNIDLNGIRVNMTMTAAEVDATTFAVGTAELPSAPQAQAALEKMKEALVRNIGGTVREQKILTIALSPGAGGGHLAVLDITASGRGDAATGGRPRMLFARFLAKDQRVFQLVATGPEQELPRDLADTFFSSFKLD